MYDDESVNIKIKADIMIWLLSSKSLTFEVLEPLLSGDFEETKQYLQDAITLFYLVEVVHDTGIIMTPDFKPYLILAQSDHCR